MRRVAGAWDLYVASPRIQGGDGIPGGGPAPLGSVLGIVICR